MAGFVTKVPPEGGLWRVARGPNPFALREPPPPLVRASAGDAGKGNRFDSALGNFRVAYFATELEGCYGETLSVLRPEPAVQAAAGDEEGFMALGDVPADWRSRRICVRASLPEGRAFLDVEALGTRAALREELGWVLGDLGLDDIDVGAIRSRDRRLTRWIAQWVWHQLGEEHAPDYGGVRFLSRLNDDWECWAVFEDVLVQEEERRSVLRQDDALQRVAELYGLDLY